MANYINLPYKKTSIRKVLFSLLSDSYESNNAGETDYTIYNAKNKQGSVHPAEILSEPELPLIDSDAIENRLNKLKVALENNIENSKKMDSEFAFLKGQVMKIENRMETVEDIHYQIKKEFDQIKKSIDKEIEKALNKINHDYWIDLRTILEKWIGKRIIVHTDEFDAVGVLMEVLPEHLTLVISEDVYIIPFKNIDFLRRKG